MKTLISLAISGILATCFAFAEDTGAQGKALQEFSKHWKTSRDFTMAVADAMPAESYDFKPNKDEMTFGEVMAHIALSNANTFSRISGGKSPFTKPEKADKESVTKLLRDSYEHCGKVLADMKEDQYEKTVGSGTAREAMLGAFTHTAHHRGQAEVYLRVKDIKPPQYKF